MTNSIQTMRISRQRGIVLVMALLILMVMTVISATMINSATLQERMASNLQTQNATFHAADSCFGDTINNTPTGNISQILQTAVNNLNVAQTNNCNTGVGADLYGPALNTSASALSDGSTFVPVGFSVGTFIGLEIDITSASTLNNTGASTNLQINGGVIVPNL